MAIGKFYEGVGRRKSSIARVRLFSGAGDYQVNERPVAQYFSVNRLLTQVMAPLKVTQNESRFTVSAQVKGGGPIGQSDAVALGLARALLEADESLKPALRKAGLLTRDPRVKERKKPGLKKARKAKQYTKR